VNATSAFLDVHVAAGRGSDAAIVTPAATHSFADVLAAARSMAGTLGAIGVSRGDRVALLLPDGLEFAAAFFGALRLGAVAVPLNPRLRPADHLAALRDSDAKVLVAGRGAAASVDAARSAGLPTQMMDGSPGALPATTVLAKALDPAPVGHDAPAFWLYTSGTTGAPKAAVHRHGDLIACHHYGAGVLGVTRDDAVFSTSRLFFAYALGNALLIPLFAGGRTFLHPGWPDVDAAVDVVRSFRPTLFFSVPTFYARLLRAELPTEAFSSVRACVSAGERLPPEIYSAWRDRFGVEILDGVGATETIFMVLSNRPGQSRPGCSGTPVPGTDVRLLDADGRDVRPGGEGVLHVRAPSVSREYWSRPDESRRAFAGGWFRTGDVYALETDGAFVHRGREDELFKVAGMWVRPADVEQALLEHPDVLEAGVVGAEDDRGLVKAFAFVVPAPSAGAGLVQALEAALGTRLATHQRPARISLLEELPRTATGKLQRHRLRASVAASRSIC
jgi:benzoate-CoA ligase